MSGLGELVTPEHAVWLPGAVRAWLNQINEQIRSLGADIGAHREQIVAAAEGPRFISDFDAFRTRWLAFNNTASTWWGSTVGAAQEYVNAYNMLERRFRAITGVAPTVYAELAEGEGPSTLRTVNYTLMAWSVIGIAGVVGLGYLVSNYAKVKTLSKLTLNRGRRSRRRLR